jgi:acetylornithine deacetylase/succinyl-diaminopimelate desuccinylase-like protein
MRLGTKVPVLVWVLLGHGHTCFVLIASVKVRAGLVIDPGDRDNGVHEQKGTPMPKIIALLAIAYLSCCQILVSASESVIGDNFPADFKQKAFEHIEHLSEFGPRSPGAEGEQKSIQYISQQFRQMGLGVQIETFDFESFEIDKFVFTICGEDIEPEMVGFNPYNGQYSFNGEPVVVKPTASSAEFSQTNLQNQIVVTTSPVSYFSLVYQNPLLIVYMDNSDFATLADKDCTSCSLAVEGSMVTHSSANIVAEFPPGTPHDKEVIISAHWDSYRDSPGADDNGSGVGVLLELARYFSTFEHDLGGRIKFVSFGAEELGVVGSRAYLDLHQDDLQDCILLFNMDQVGGPQGPSIEMLGGVQGIPEVKGTTQFPARLRNRAWEGLDGRWRLVNTEAINVFAAANRPPWLREAIEASAKEFGYSIRPSGNMGSDQMVFTQAGIVATSIGTGGNQNHSPKDIPAQIYKDNLEVAGKIVANVILMSLGGDE